MSHDDETGHAASAYGERIKPLAGHDKRLTVDPDRPLEAPGVSVERERELQARRLQHELNERERSALQQLGEQGYGTETAGTHRPAGQGGEGE